MDSIDAISIKNMKRLSVLFFALLATAHADIVTVPAVGITGLTAGNNLSILNEAEHNGEIAAGNRIYADLENGFDSGVIPSNLIGAKLIRTKDTDRGSTAADTISFTLNSDAQVCIWHSDDIANPAWIASDGYTDSSYDIGPILISSLMSGYCDTKTGAVSLDGNTTDGDTEFPMYFVTIASSVFRVPDFVAPGGAGVYDFALANYAVSESTTDDVACVVRSGGNSGAVTVDITQGAGSTCSAPDSTYTDPETISWADGVDGFGTGGSNGCLSFQANAVSGDCNEELTLNNASGGIGAGTLTDTTVLVDDIPASPSDYWVAKTGSDGNSCATAETEGTPKLTIGSGMGCLSPGETLTVKAGTYAEDFDTIPNGTSWQDVVTVTAKAGDTVIIAPTGSFPRCGTLTNKQYIEISGFECTVAGLYDGFKLDGTTHHVRLQDMEIHGSSQQGLLDGVANNSPGVGGNNEFLNLTIYDTGEDSLDHGIYITTQNNKVWDNIVYSVSGYSIQLWNGRADANNNDVRSNRLSDSTLRGGITVNGSNNVIANNISWDHASVGIRIGAGSGNKVYNNTLYSNTGDGVFVSGSNHEVKNNIIYLNGSTIAGSGYTASNNVTTNPTFTDAPNDDFTFTSGSSACEAGTDLSPDVTDDIVDTARPQDTNYEAGAYEVAACP